MRLPARLRQRHARPSGPPGPLEREGSIASHPEAVELPELQPRGGGAGAPDPNAHADDLSTRRGSEASALTRQSSRHKTVFGAFWATHVSVVVQPEASRDHLAIERTFLGYFRTSVMFAILSVLIGQLFVLMEHDAGYGYREIGRPMATICLCFSICTIFLGVHRTWHHQHAVVSGKAIAGGFEIATLAFGTLALSTVFFGLLVSVNVVTTAAS